MSWLMTAFAAALSAVAGGAGMLGIGTLCVDWYKIPAREGESGYYVIFMGLAGAVGGLIIGTIAARVGLAKVSPAWYGQVGVALGAVLAALVLVLAFAYLGADTEKDEGGRGLWVAWEVRLPAPGGNEAPADPASWKDEEMRLQLVSVISRQPRGHAEALWDKAAFRREGEQWILPARVELFTSKGELCVNLRLPGVDDGFWPPLSPKPREGDFSWSAWQRTNKSREKASDAEALMYRFRVERGPAA